MRLAIKIFILIIHFILLIWILYLLSNGGAMLMKEVALHFTGISLLGFLTIRGTSYIEMKLFKKDLKDKRRK